MNLFICSTEGKTKAIFSYPCNSRESIALGSDFRNGDFDAMRSLESENQSFSIWSICMFVCYQHMFKTSCTRNTKFGILHLCHIQMLLKTFYKDRTKIVYRGKQKNSNTLRPMKGTSCY